MPLPEENVMMTDGKQPSTTEDLTGQALFRAAGAPLIFGNRVRLLKDAAENYPAWIEAIESAEKWIHFESYIIHDDEAGARFADLLSAKAQEGVKVRVIYDWVGSLGNAPSRFWRRLVASGVDVRCFNRLRLDSPFGWTSRDHRKLISVDGRIAYVTGLCVGQRWIGYPDRGLEPWRDTGIEIEGPALVDIEEAFADMWAMMGAPLPSREFRFAKAIPDAGNVGLRIVASVPNVGGVYRLDQVIATLARQSIWLSDAYFIGTASYVQALRSAAQSGVDVRFLIPGANDVPVMRAMSRAGLRPLLEGGIRVFEWNGSMMHAKTAVADGKWARVGSTNLNLTSWLGNWELDVIVEDELFALGMEQMFLDDLSHSTEIVLGTKRRPIARLGGSKSRSRAKSGSAVRTAAGVMRLSHAVGAAITNRRELGPAEAIIMTWGALLLAVVSFIAAYWPRAVAFPTAVVCLWLAISLLIRAYQLRTTRKHRRR
jgi:cardiolipin synthase